MIEMIDLVEMVEMVDLVEMVEMVEMVDFRHSNLSQSESSHVFDEIANFTNLCRSQDPVIRIT
jgi:hypothetical protein